MTILQVLTESSSQIKKNRVSEYQRVRIDGEDIKLHIAIKATGKTMKEILSLKDKPKKEREETEKTMINKIKAWREKNLEIDHTNGNKEDNSKNNLKALTKTQHTIKTNKTARPKKYNKL